jgi:hypothetical protein
MKKMIVNTQQDAALTRLRELLPPGSKVYTTLKHKSRSGMMRHITLAVVDKEGIRDISWDVAKVLEYKQADNGGIKVGGCGMDMGFHLVYSLGRRLYPDGFKLAPNQYGRNGNTSGFDNDGGYSLRHEWL